MEATSPWSTGAFILIIIGSVLLPLFGVIFGIIGLLDPSKKKQGVATLVTGIVAFVVRVLIVIGISFFALTGFTQQHQDVIDYYETITSGDAFQVIDDGTSSLEADELDAILKELEKELDNTNR